ncbi:hemerythrin domain-containing protein [Candidatus Methylomirabilis sp.]|uniref:hemerythrin domain-containing protein n=1 Tax=Candidatus Methylomirabilis sp. TaxID=2032687 RepID=UPI002A5F2C8A|nr:hemerythrin domain-containing protein [Candidatus Methylomirabilis sp.]
MSMLVERLKREHVIIVDALNKTKEVGVGSKEGQDKLRSARTALLAHLKTEDEQLYPVLKKEAEKNDSLKRTLDLFAREMETISTEALSFVDKYSNGGSGLEFARDFGRLYMNLSQRVRKEENTLYSEYDKLHR